MITVVVFVILLVIVNVGAGGWTTDISPSAPQYRYRIVIDIAAVRSDPVVLSDATGVKFTGP